MAGTSSRLFKISALDATTVTLVPAVGEVTTPDFADSIASVVVTFTTARDSNAFDVLNRQVAVSLETL